MVMAPAFFQASSILRYSVILFCRFLAATRFAALMLSMPDEHAVGAGASRLLDEVRDLVAEGIDLHHQLDLQSSRVRAAR